MRRPQLLVLALATSAAGGLFFISHMRRHDSPAPLSEARAAAPPSAAWANRIAETYAGRPEAAKAAYEQFIHSHGTDASPVAQEQVGLARFRIAYLDGTSGEFKKARKEFLQTAALYKGDGTMSGDFGGVKDGALYQAAVCLVGMGKKAEAKKAFEAFLENQPQSPLCKAAFVRLQRLMGGKAPAFDVRLLDSALAAQQHAARRAQALCGPKCLAQLLVSLGKPAPNLQRLAALSDSGESGASMEGMRLALKALGVRSFGYVLAAGDFREMPLPAILLE